MPCLGDVRPSCALQTPCSCVYEEDTSTRAGSSLANLANSPEAVSQNDSSLFPAFRVNAPAAAQRVYMKNGVHGFGQQVDKMVFVRLVMCLFTALTLLGSTQMSELKRKAV